MRKGQKLSPMPDMNTLSQFNNNILPSLVGVKVKTILRFVKSYLIIHAILNISCSQCLPTTKDITVPNDDDIICCDVLTRITLTSSFIVIIRNL